MSQMFARASLAMITGYQRYLSPRKGFACAYRVQNGGTGCSGYAKFAIRDHGLWRALPLIRARFRDCHAAALAMTHDADQADRKPRKRPKRNGCVRQFLPEFCIAAVGGGSLAAHGQSVKPVETGGGDASSCTDGVGCDGGCDGGCGNMMPSCDFCSCGG